MTDDDVVDASAPTEVGQTLDESGGASERASFARAAGEKIGRFVVLGTLGNGAMGVVFAAFDPDLDRKVALKLLRRPEKRAADGSAATMRLLREARAMAKVSHPNVLAIHEVGTFGEQVFLAMEYAAGGTLRAWCAAEPRAWQEVVARFVQAGRGLQAAHEAGLVHRDFKPENVLVTKDGAMRVADFGIVGRSNGQTPGAAPRPEELPLDLSLTTTGTLIGTPAYMAPEQHRCEEAGPAADQFAFCVSLWEALYGVRPFAGATYGELAVNVIDDNVTEPPADRDVPRWLREVVRRGMRANPAERWPSMDALLDALEADPVAARRRRLRVAAVALALVALAGVAAFALLRSPKLTSCDAMDRRLAGVWDDTRKEKLRSALTATKRWYAEDTYARVAQRLDDYAHEWVAARGEACRLDEIHSDADESPRIACLEGRLADLRELVNVLSKGPDVAVLDEAAQAADRLLPVSGCSDPATLATVTRPPDHDTSVAITRLRERQAAARALNIAGRPREALAATVPLVAEAERIGYAPTLAAMLSLRANIETQLGDFSAAEATLRRTLEVAADAHDDALAVGTWSSLIFVVGASRGRPDEALQMRTAAEAALRRAGRNPEAEAVMLLSVGYVLAAQQQYDKAQATFDQALALMQRARGADDLRSGIVLHALGSASLARNDMQHAKVQLGRALAILEKRLGPQHPALRDAYALRGKALSVLGEHGEAAAAYEHALALAVRAFGEENVEVASLHRKLGYQLYVLHRDADARVHLEKAVAIRERLYGADHEQTVNALNDLGKLSFAEGKLAEARAQQERARAGLEKASPGSTDLAECLHDLAEVLLAQHEAAPARDAALRAIELGDANKASPAVLAPTRFLLARALWDLGDHAHALELAHQARDTFDLNASTTFTGQAFRDPDKIAADIAAWLSTRSE